MELGLYKHFKGKFYQVLDVAKHSETLEDMVVYQALYGDMDVWVRPKRMFEEKVADAKGQTVERFGFVYNADQLEEADLAENDEGFVLLRLFASKEEAEAAGSALDQRSISHKVYEESLNPQPECMPSANLYKIYVAEDRFEDAVGALG
jgi:hypothetical protein